jgi:hypothetical protein
VQWIAIARSWFRGGVRFIVSTFAFFWRWVGGRWKWETILGVALGMVRLGEYAISLMLLALAGLAAASKITHWEGPATNPIGLIRFIGYFVVTCSCLIVGIIVVSVKGNDPWSHLPAARNRFIDSHWSINQLDSKTLAGPWYRLLPSRPSEAILAQPHAPKAKRDVSVVAKTNQQGEPDLTLEFFGTDRLAFCIENRGPQVASDPKYTIVLVDLTNQWRAPPAVQDRMPGTQPLPIPTKLVNDFVRTNECLGSFAIIPDEVKQFVKDGDRLFGMIWITCPQCKLTRSYWLGYEAWKVGWYSYNDPARNIPLFMRRDLSASDADQLVSEFIPVADRMMIPVENNHTLMPKPH